MGQSRASIAVINPITGVSVQLPVAMITYITIQAGAVLDVRGLNFQVLDAAVVLDQHVIGFAKLLADSLAVPDDISRATSKPLADAASIQDDFSRTVGFLRQFVEAVGAPDGKVITLDKSLMDVAVLSDVHTTTFAKSVVDGVSMNDSASMTDGFMTSFTKTVANMAFLNDAANLSVSKLLADSFAAADAGSLRNQSYVDPTYLAEDYVGASLTF